MPPETSEAKADTKGEARESGKGVAGKPDAAAPAEAPKRKKPRIQEAAVRIRNVTRTFGATIAVSNLTMHIPAGMVYGLIGPNGAGKTTTFSMLAGYLAPSDGEIEVLGFRPDHVSELRARVGVLPQDALLPPLDLVGEFLTHMARLQGVPSSKAAGHARDALGEVDGKEWWKMRCGALSHGMAKRVALAQALLGEPEVVLLDEPTAGLDPKVAYEVRQLIASRKGRCTLIVSSHNLTELEQICDAAAILDRGKLIASGTIAELTAATEEVHFKVTVPPDSAFHGSATAMLEAVRALPLVKLAEYEDIRTELVVYFEREKTDAEGVIEVVLRVLIDNRARISGVTKGRGLEQRVMALT
jgi:ABC-2 type transport system ATP-binding protein